MNKSVDGRAEGVPGTAEAAGTTGAAGAAGATGAAGTAGIAGIAGIAGTAESAGTAAPRTTTGARPAHADRIAFVTIVRKEIRRFARIWVQTIVPPAINALLYLLIFGGLIGSRIDGMAGHSYVDFIVPGIVMMAIIVNSYSNVVSSFFGAKFQHHIEEMLVSPISNLTILAGFVVGGVARGLIVGALVAVVGLAFTGHFPVHPILTLVVAVLTAVMFSLGGLINAVFAKSFDDISIVPNFILTPLTYLGGVFYSIALLPPLWANLSLLNPVLYMVNGFRYGMLGASDIPVWQSFAVILVFIGLFGAVAMTLLNRGTGIKE